MDKYAGYLYCAECGSRLYLHRSKNFDPNNNNFMCGGYRTKNGKYCYSHYIRECVLDEIVLTSLRNIKRFARENPKEFYAMATKNDEAGAKQYIEMPKLTPELMRMFIKRIEVYEKEEKYSRSCGNRIEIQFTFQSDLRRIHTDGVMVNIPFPNENGWITNKSRGCNALGNTYKPFLR